jgi:hypothetical protein
VRMVSAFLQQVVKSMVTLSGGVVHVQFLVWLKCSCKRLLIAAIISVGSSIFLQLMQVFEPLFGSSGTNAYDNPPFLISPLAPAHFFHT